MQVVERSNQWFTELENPVGELTAGEAEKVQDEACKEQEQQDSECKCHELSDLVDNEGKEGSCSAHKPPHP